MGLTFKCIMVIVSDLTLNVPLYKAQVKWTVTPGQCMAGYRDARCIASIEDISEDACKGGSI